MSYFLCFICHSTVHSDTNTETREKYRELVGMKLCSDSHLCHICCHLLKKLWLFKSICLRRSMEYPVLFSDRGTVNLHNSQIETIVLCPDSGECDQISNNAYHFSEPDNVDTNQYVSLEDRIDDNVETMEDKEGKHDTDDDLSNDDNSVIDDSGVIDDNGIINDNGVIDDYDDTKDNDVDETKAEVQTHTANAAEKESNINNDFYKIVLSVEEQKAELEQKRREDKYLEAEFKCYNCAMGFLFKDTYQAHMMRHEESNGEHLCPICLLRFASLRVARAHAQAHRERHACARCGRRVPPGRRRAHVASCANLAQVMCHLCSKSFSDGNALQQHIKRFHLSKTSNKTYSCHVCGKTYNNQAAVRTHMIKHINRKFPCPQCPARFSSPYSLAAHSGRHGARPQQCAPCRRVYSSRGGLRAHRATARSHQHTLLVCQICSKTCATERSLASHVQTVHSSERPFGCALCGARYTTDKSLRAHLRRHRAGDPKRCICHICGTTFQSNSKLNRHLRSVCEKNKLEEELSDFYNQE